MAGKIKASLSTRDSYGKSVGIVSVANNIPNLESLDPFFSTPDSYRKGKKFMIMVASSYDECKT